jgi:hypothetical protein
MTFWGVMPFLLKDFSRCQLAGNVQRKIVYVSLAHPTPKVYFVFSLVWLVVWLIAVAIKYILAL